MTRLVIWMTLAITSAGWQVEWQPHPDNSILMISVLCDGFQATSRYTIDPEDSHAITHRVTPPAGAFCIATAEIMRNPDHDGVAEHEIVGESTSLTIQ